MQELYRACVHMQKIRQSKCFSCDSSAQPDRLEPWGVPSVQPDRLEPWGVGGEPTISRLCGRN